MLDYGSRSTVFFVSRVCDSSLGDLMFQESSNSLVRSTAM